MKKIVLFLIFLSFFTTSFSQKADQVEQKVTINEILKLKPNNYFSLEKIGFKDFKTPIDTLQLLNSESEKIDYVLGQIYALHLLGINYRNDAEYELSIRTLEKALEMAKDIEDPSAKIVLLNTIGSTYRRKNDIKNAITYHQYALTEAMKIKNQTPQNRKSVGIAENSIGNIYVLLKQYDLALEQFDKAIRIQEELDDLHGLALNYQNIGYAQEKLGDLEKALENYKTSLEFNIQNNSKAGKIICNNSICSILIKQGQYDEALEIAKKNFVVAKKIENKKIYSQTICRLGWAFLKVNDFKNAKKTLEESIYLAKKYKYTTEFIESSFHLSTLYSLLEDNEKAFYHYKQAIETENNTSGERNLIYVNNLINNHNSQIKLNQLKTLQDQVKIRTYEFSRSRNVLIITLVSLALLSVALYSIYRQRLLNNDRRVLMLEQQALQAQMNPHFIFNALNSIKLYIINNDQKQAVYYLNKFSKLIRNILDVSKIKEVSLTEELKTMELYMSIENIRFNNEIEYSQKINSTLNLDTIKVPPLILQPFLENAIWHGLSSKEGEKKVVLSAFKVSKNLIEISIADNGVGRKIATDIKKNKSLKRKSIGIDLTIERLKTFSNDFVHDFSLKYYDLKDENETPKGTKVALRIPLR